MRSPTPEQLPPPPAGKAGWPWTWSPLPPDTISSASSLPAVIVVTPSYNQAQFLEETIRSVLLQGYPNLDYMVIDGGSKDGSVEIIRRYEPWLTYWVSEPDLGQADAINKGLGRSTGDIAAWLNSDDVYTPNALREMSSYFAIHPDAAVIYGDADFIDVTGKHTSRFRAQPFRPPQMFFDHFIPQPSAFIRRPAFDRAGGLDTLLHFCMDYDLWLRIALLGRLDYLPRVWSSYRVHAASKGSNLQALRWAETAQILSKFFARTDLDKAWRRYHDEAIGRAHWHAVVEYYRAHNDEKTSEHLGHALGCHPGFIATREFAGILVGDRANQTTEEILELLDGFFRLMPDQTAHKRQAFALARARAEALIAMNDSTPLDRSRDVARSAIKHDPYWLLNRHVLRRALR